MLLTPIKHFVTLNLLLQNKMRKPDGCESWLHYELSLKGTKNIAYLLILQNMSNCYCDAKLMIKWVNNISWQPQRSSLPDATFPNCSSLQ